MKLDAFFWIGLAQKIQKPVVGHLSEGSPTQLASIGVHNSKEDMMEKPTAQEGDKGLLSVETTHFSFSIHSSCTTPCGVDLASNEPLFNQGTGEFPLPLAGQWGHEHGGNGLPKKPARAFISIE